MRQVFRPGCGAVGQASAAAPRESGERSRSALAGASGANRSRASRGRLARKPRGTERTYSETFWAAGRNAYLGPRPGISSSPPKPLTPQPQPAPRQGPNQHPQITPRRSPTAVQLPSLIQHHRFDANCAPPARPHRASRIPGSTAQPAARCAPAAASCRHSSHSTTALRPSRPPIASPRRPRGPAQGGICPDVGHAAHQPGRPQAGALL